MIQAFQEATKGLTDDRSKKDYESFWIVQHMIGYVDQHANHVLIPKFAYDCRKLVKFQSCILISYNRFVLNRQIIQVFSEKEVNS